MVQFTVEASTLSLHYCYFTKSWG